jgi:hypothetical protein
MASVGIVLDYEIYDGMSLTFKAPCDCTNVDSLNIIYEDTLSSGSITKAKIFNFKDANGNILTGVGNLFSAGSYVKVVLDTVNNFAFIQNADTNAYLEGEFDKKVSKSGDTMDGNLMISNSAPGYYLKNDSTGTIISMFNSDLRYGGLWDTVGNSSVLSYNFETKKIEKLPLDFQKIGYSDADVTLYSGAPATISGYKLQKNDFMNACLFRGIVKTTAKLTKGTGQNLLVVPDSLVPGSYYALSCYCTAGKLDAVINTSGNVRVHPHEDIASGSTIYISGFWFI